MFQYADYEDARNHHHIQLSLNGVSHRNRQTILDKFDRMLVAMGPPDWVPKSMCIKGEFYYDAQDDQLYFWEGPGIIHTTRPWAWHPIGKDSALDKQLPICQYYYNLYHADSP